MGFLRRVWRKTDGYVSWRGVISTYIIILLSIIYVSYLNTAERNHAVNDFCTVQEQRNLENVTNLRRTYNYLENQTDEQLQNDLNAAILRFLPRTEDVAKTDVAPPLCDETYKSGVLSLVGLGETKDYGLPEPDPELPERPDNIIKFVPPPTS